MLNPEIVTNRRPIDRLSRNAAIAKIAQRVQPVVAEIWSRVPLAVRNVVNGTILGHPLHPAITDVPIGAWTVTAVLDTLELASSRRLPGADSALVIGFCGAVGAAITGYADWSDTKDDPRTLGMAHAMCNSGAVALYTVAFVLRRGEHRKRGLAVALGGYGLLAFGAYLGGELAFGQMIGPKHTAEPLTPAIEYTAVLAAVALGSTPMRAEFRGIPILVSRTSTGVAAILAACTHRGAPLDQGTFAEDCVRCPWHGSSFALSDGSVRSGPATFPQPRFDARINGDWIEVRALTSSGE